MRSSIHNEAPYHAATATRTPSVTATLDGGVSIVKLNKVRSIEKYGREFEERYRFTFGSNGKLKKVQLRVLCDSDGSGYVTNEVVEAHEIELNDVPTEVAQSVSEITGTMAEEI